MARISRKLANAMGLRVKPARRRAKLTGRFRSQLEADFAKVLDGMLVAGEITGWDYEPFTLKTPGGSKYTPDFILIYPDSKRLVEVKGYLRRHESLLYKEIAAAFPVYRLALAMRKDGKWKYSVIGKSRMKWQSEL